MRPVDGKRGTLESFFQAPASKRPKAEPEFPADATDAPGAAAASPPGAAATTSPADGTSAPEPASTLSPEAARRAALNKALALARLRATEAAAAHAAAPVFSLRALLTEPSWAAALAPALAAPSCQALQRFLAAELAHGAVFPDPPQLFRALNAAPLPSVRLVVLGQDPYHTPGAACGLAFSVPRGQPVPSSLQNVYKELGSDLGPAFGPKPGHGDLARWAAQGVLLLNTSLSVRRGEAGSHAGKGWEAVTDAVITALLRRPGAPHTVFLLWGKHAQTKAAGPLRAAPKGSVTLLSAPHPSGLSAHRGFLGCRCFSQANAALVKAGLEPIDWRVD